MLPYKTELTPTRGEPEIRQGIGQSLLLETQTSLQKEKKRGNMFWTVFAACIVFFLALYILSEFIAPRPIKLNGAHVLVLLSLSLFLPLSLLSFALYTQIYTLYPRVVDILGSGEPVVDGGWEVHLTNLACVYILKLSVNYKCTAVRCRLKARRRP